MLYCRIEMTTHKRRAADHPIDPIFLERWSPRAFTGEAIDRAELLTILEAGRWAPSSMNAQPWRFLYALRDTPPWETFLNLLVPNNRGWACQAATLVYIVSRKTMKAWGDADELPSSTHSFDAGIAAGFIALQAHRMDWATHGMAGFDHDQMIRTLNVPAGFKAEAAFAIGRTGDPAILPDALRQRERPSDRLPLAAIAFEGKFSLPD